MQLPHGSIGDALPQTSRRSLIVGAATVSLLGAAPEPAGAGGRKRGPIVVVGAGMAGITAAHRLHRHGYDVRVVEARHRIGGRIHSWRGWPGSTIDLGASWIHGYAAGNPLTPIARRAGARLTPSSYSSGALHIDPALRAAGLTRPHSGRWAQIVDEAERHAQRRPHDTSLAEAVRRQVADLDLDHVETHAAGVLPERELHDRVG